MTRIAGVIGGPATAAIERVVKGLAAGAVVPSPFRKVVEFRPDVAVGTIGHRDNSLFENGRIAVLLDGRIYNRRDFSLDGDDTALFAALYDRYGFEGTLARINGDFAVAVYDGRDATLWFARDRIGIKPLYYASSPNAFAFASRPRALLSLPGIDSRINAEFAALVAGSHYRYIDNRPDHSPYQDVSQAVAGHWYRFRNGALVSGRYWTLEDAPDFEETEAELAAQYRDLLLDAVDMRRRSSLRPAFTLSGGMDSSSVLACAGKGTAAPQTAYSTVYNDKTFDESTEIQSMLEDGRIAWNRVCIGDEPDIFAVVEGMVAAHDEPVATATWLSHFLLCGHVAQAGHDTLFGGLGGDELNAGEYEYFFYRFADLKREKNGNDLAHEIACWARYHDHPIWRKDAAVAEAVIARCTDATVAGRCLPDRTRMRRYFHAIEPEFLNLEGFEPVMEAPFSSYLKTRTYQDMTRETTPCCLRAEDRQGAAYGIENTLPFLDHRLVEFMFRVPGHMKIRDGITKRLLREAMREILPEETRTRIKKTGWNAPAHVWFGGTTLEKLTDLVHSRRFRERGIYNLAAVERIISEHKDIVTTQKPQDNHMMFLWQLLNLETWLNQPPVARA